MKARSNPPRQMHRVLLAAGEARRARRQDQLGERAGFREAGEGIFELVTSRRGGHVYLSVHGHLDEGTSSSFSEAVETLLRGGARSIVVDLGGATVDDEAGASALDGARGMLEGHEGELMLKSPRGSTLALLGRMGLRSAFLIG
jgi:anti-sigma B factor antagonist